MMEIVCGMSTRGLSHPNTQTKKVKSEVHRLCAKLQGRRLALNMTQEEFAEKADISVSMIRQLETGHKIPSFPMFVYLSGLLKLEISIQAE